MAELKISQFKKHGFIVLFVLQELPKAGWASSNMMHCSCSRLITILPKSGWPVTHSDHPPLMPLDGMNIFLAQPAQESEMRIQFNQPSTLEHVRKSNIELTLLLLCVVWKKTIRQHVNLFLSHTPRKQHFRPFSVPLLEATLQFNFMLLLLSLPGENHFRDRKNTKHSISLSFLTFSACF